jgi:2-polyprenyl-3-methyl-5-hydroxy-6-metoxy-1,4-benzoquinol methylase
LLYRRGPFGVVQCPECRQAFISPRLVARDRDQIYADCGYFDQGLYGDRSGRAVKEVWESARLKLITERRFGDMTRIAAIRDRVPGPGERLLEIGCAYGGFLQKAQRLGFDVTGVEYSPAAVGWIRKNTQLDVRSGAIETAGLDPGQFDVVCFFDVVEHVENPPAFLKTLTELARPDGCLVLSCPNFGSLPARFFRSRWWSLRPSEHIWQFTTDTLTRLLRDAGLREIRTYASPLRRANLFRTDSMLATARR